MTTEEEIKIVHGGKRHVVILGAGASLAATLRNPEKGKKSLPLMNNLVEVCGLNKIVESLPNEIKILKDDFEKLYSTLSKLEKFNDERKRIEDIIYAYFESMDLPDCPTIYDYLILSLRHKKDIIATFNWDPFLYKAYLRNSKFVAPPAIVFLHGNVSIGFDKTDGSSGPAGMFSYETGKRFEPTKILFPITKKDYNSDTYIRGQWEALSRHLKDAECVSIFGYSAPKTDVEAISLLQNAWGTVNERNMEQFEFIDVRKEKELLKSWKTFVHSHHYFYSTDYFKSSLANHPRRTVESYHHWADCLTPSQAFQEGNKVPDNFRTLDEMWEWFSPLIAAEKKFYEDD